MRSSMSLSSAMTQLLSGAKLRMPPRSSSLQQSAIKFKSSHYRPRSEGPEKLLNLRYRPNPSGDAALFGCAVLTGVGAVINTAKVSAGSSVAVIGLGGVGLSSLLGAVAVGARRVVAVDLSDDKLGLARQLGATDTFNSGNPDAIEEIRAATGGGVEFAFEMAGSVRALDLAYRITHRGGSTVTAGLPPPNHTCALPQINLVAEERTVKGSYIGTCVPVRDLPRYIALHRQGRLPVRKLLSGLLALEAINEGFDRLREGKAIRQVVVF